MKTPRVVLGTMTFGGQTSEEDATKMVLDFATSEKWSDLVRATPELDSAIMYQGGETERVLGRILESHPTLIPPRVGVASKANPFAADRDLSPSGLRSQLESTLRSLRLPGVDVYYLHAPDARHDVEPALEEIQRMFTEGKFRRFGLSNFTAWETVYVHSYMSSRGYVVPTVYQGMYNAITRRVEGELFPALRKLGMSFYAYNPLAGGMLSGKYAPAANDDELQEANSRVGSRFGGSTFWARRYRERFQQREQFKAIEVVRSALAEGGDDMADASLRWLRHHSELREGDGIIVGASTLGHFNANMESLARCPLSPDVVKAFQEAYRLCRDVCPDYSRGYCGSQKEQKG